MIEYRTSGSIFDGQLGARVVVIPVNCVGVAGKGVALDARNRWPDWDKAYRKACGGSFGLLPGGIHAYDRGPEAQPRWVISAATKDHWRQPSQMCWVRTCLTALVEHAQGLLMQTPRPVYAVPALGCGLGGLPWPTVKAEMDAVFTPVSGVTWVIFQPQ